MKKIAETEVEWWEMVRSDMNKHNYKAHNEDQFSLDEWVGEMYGYEIYGWRVLRDNLSSNVASIEQA